MQQWVTRGLIALISIVIVSVGVIFGSTMLIDPERIKPYITSQVEQATGRKLSIQGDISPSLSLLPTLRANKVRLANQPWGNSQDFLKADEITITFELLPLLFGNFYITEIGLNGAHVWLEQQGKQTNWTFKADEKPNDEKPDNAHDDATKAQTPNLSQEQAEQPTETASESLVEEATNEESTFQIDRILVTNSRLHYANLSEDESYQVQIDRLEMSAISAGTIGNMHLTGSYEASTLIASAQLEDNKLQLDATASKPALRLNVRGSLATTDGAFDGSLRIDAERMDALLALLQIESNDTTALSVDAQLGGTTELLSVNRLNARYGDYDLSARGKADLTSTQPAITGNVEMAKLDLRGESKPAHAPESNSDSATTIPNEPLPYKLLEGFSADIHLLIREIRLNAVTFTQAEADVKIRDRNLSLSNLALGTASGRLTGKADLNAAAVPPTLEVNLESERLSLGALLLELANDDSVTGGRITASLTLNGHGQTLHDVVSSANGTYNMLIEEATYSPPQGIQNASAFFDLLRGGSGSGPVTVKCAVADFDIQNGLAESTALAIKSPAAIVTGDGLINLASETLRVELKARSTAIGLADAVPPLIIDGPWSDPNITLSAKQTLFTIGKYALGAATGVGLFAVLGETVTDKLGITAENHPCIKAFERAEERAAEADANPEAAYKEAEDNIRNVRDDIKGNVKDTLKDAEDATRSLRDGLKQLGQ